MEVGSTIEKETLMFFNYMLQEIKAPLAKSEQQIVLKREDIFSDTLTLRC